jgi:hypothetical protein
MCKATVRLTDLTLSCAAKARVPRPKRHGGCRRGVAKPRLATCNRRDAGHAGDEVGSPAAGPKPGRTSFSVKLGATKVGKSRAMALL